MRCPARTPSCPAAAGGWSNRLDSLLSNIRRETRKTGVAGYQHVHRAGSPINICRREGDIPSRHVATQSCHEGWTKPNRSTSLRLESTDFLGRRASVGYALVGIGNNRGVL